MNNSYTATACAALILASVWACDGRAENTSGAAGGKLIEPATILSGEDVRELTGIDFAECSVKERPAVGLKLCVYEKDGALVQVGLTQVAFMDGRRGQTPESIYHSIKEAFPQATTIDGLGDDNFLAPPGLHILANGYYITLSLGLADADRDKLKASGATAVANLERLTESR